MPLLPNDPVSVVHLIDDDEPVRQSLAFLLASTGHAVRVYDSAAAFLLIAAGVRTGCVISDLRMPDIDGLELQRRLKELGSDLPVIFITGHGDVTAAVQAMKAGALDFIEKPFEDDVILDAVRLAFEQNHQPGARNAEAAQVAARLAALSPREREVLDGLVAGMPNKTIAYDLKLSPRTVEVHRANLMIKMEARSLSSLVRMALVANILTTG